MSNWLRSIPTIRTARFRRARSSGWRGSCGRANKFAASHGTISLIALLVATGIAAAQIAQDFVPPPSRDVTPPGITPAPVVDGPLVREPVPPPPPELPRWRRFHLPATVDAATFTIEKRTIRVAGVTAKSADDTCQRADGTNWPCGRTALHSLRMFLRGRSIECYFPHADTAVEITAPCRVGKSDLGFWLLSQGWATPGDYATDEYKEVARKAECAKRGLWQGSADRRGCGPATN